MNDNTDNVIPFPEMSDVTPTFYNMTFKAWHETDGLLGSRYSKEETLEKVRAEMVEVYGEGNFEITSFEPVSEEEQAALELQLNLVPDPKSIN